MANYPDDLWTCDDWWNTLMPRKTKIYSCEPTPPPETPKEDNGITVADLMKELVIGQDHAVDKIAAYIDIYEAGLHAPGRPPGVFLLLGPTGVGKTETVEALADVIHGTRRNYIRVDCGELQQDHDATARMAGSPPGYIGHKDTPALITQERLETIKSGRSPLTLVLFDEIEKAANSLHRLLLAIFDKGTHKTGDNKTVDYSNTLIFMTSNLGAAEMIQAVEGNPFNFVKEKRDVDFRSRGMKAARQRFPPEFVNRIDEIITYKSFTRETASRIVSLELDKMLKRMWTPTVTRGQIKAELAKSINGYLTDSVLDSSSGARGLKRTIQREIAYPVAKMYLSGVRNMNVILRDGKIVVKPGQEEETV